MLEPHPSFPRLVEPKTVWRLVKVAQDEAVRTLEAANLHALAERCRLTPIRFVPSLGNSAGCAFISPRRSVSPQRLVPCLLSAEFFCQERNAAEIRETVLHELAHALTNRGHDALWRGLFVMLGGSGRTVHHMSRFGPVKVDFQIACMKCTKVHTRVMRVSIRRRVRCPHCFKRIEITMPKSLVARDRALRMRARIIVIEWQLSLLEYDSDATFFGQISDYRRVGG